MDDSALDDQHLSPAGLAHREGVSIETVYAWNRDRRGPRYMKIGKHVRYRLSDVLAWENTRYVVSSSVAS